MKTDYRMYRFRRTEKVRLLLVSVGITVLVDFLCYRTVWAVGIFVPVLWLYTGYQRRRIIQERKNRLYGRFRELLVSLRSALHSGYSLENAVAEAAAELGAVYGKEDLLTRELNFMVRQMKVGISAEQLFLDLGARSGITDIRTFAAVLAAAKRTGGNLEEILENTWGTFCARIDTAREIEAATAARKYEQMVMNLVPLGMILYVQAAFPDYLDVFYGNLIGRILMTACLLIYLAAFLLGERLLRVEV